MSLFLSRENDKYFKILRYLISGSIAAVTNLGSLYLFVNVFHLWYIVASGISFVLTFIVSFVLQKFWTFNDPHLDILKRQIGVSLVVAGCNLLLNTVYMYFFVEYLHLHYMQAQVLTMILVAIGSFLAYQYLIFRPRSGSVISGKTSL